MQSDPTSAPSLQLTLSPEGRLFLQDDDAEHVALEPRAQLRLRAAFTTGAGAGLFHLGAAELKTELPPSLAFFRELGRLFVTGLCALINLEDVDAISVALPNSELEQLIGSTPPMRGAEYLTHEVFAALWHEMEAAFRAEASAFEGTVEELLQHKNPVWNLVGRVCLHMAENKRSLSQPFAFMATYTTRVSGRGKLQHVPLGKALSQYAGAKDKRALLSLLLPVRRAAEKSAWVDALVRSKAIYKPHAWTPSDAYRFLQDVPLLEASGLVVRLPDWWRRRSPPRPKVQVTVGEHKKRFDLQAMLDFRVEVSVNGEPLTRAEIDDLLAGSEGLVLIKGQWVEVDKDALTQVLAHWEKVQEEVEQGGITFVEGMRWLSGAFIDASSDTLSQEDLVQWSQVRAGDALAEQLESLRDPEQLGALALGDDFKGTLRPYQETGLHWLWLTCNLGLGACLADDMGLGKTVQVLALLSLLGQAPDRGVSLLVVPASLIANWCAEFAHFTPKLRVMVAHPSSTPREQLEALTQSSVEEFDAIITTYAMLRRIPQLTDVRWEAVVLDEAQAIKNPAAKQTRASYALNARFKLAMTGTPVENRLSDLWSLFNFICPGLLGSQSQFTRFTKALSQRNDGAPDYSPLRSLIRPYILRRLKTDKRVIDDLPDKTELRTWCLLTRTQAALYQRSVESLADELQNTDGIERRGLVLTYLMRLKQICNHPSQWLGDDDFSEADSGKFVRLRALAEQIASRQEKVLIFTQFRQMIEPLNSLLAGIFKQPGLVLHGGTPIKKRATKVEAFQRDEGPPFFVLSLKAGGTGLNLTAASHVIHFDRWWNPAVEDQATDRAYRIGQRRNVLVHKFVCRGTIEERIDALIADKRNLSGEVIDSDGQAVLTELADDAILRMVALDINSALDEV